MGECYVVVNITKKEYICPSICDSGCKKGEITRNHGFPQVFTNWFVYNWGDGDKVMMLGDYNENFSAYLKTFKDISVDAINSWNEGIAFDMIYSESGRKLVFPSEHRVRERVEVIKHIDEILSEAMFSHWARIEASERETDNAWQLAVMIEREYRREMFKENMGCYPEDLWKQPVTQ
jgi:hypothetical protein